MEPEAAYLHELLRAAAEHRPPAAPPHVLSWERLAARLAARGPAIPALLHPALLARAPARVRDELSSRLERLRVKAGLLWLELARVLPALRAVDIDPIVLKGPALAATVWPDAGARFFSDLDLLVPRTALQSACTTLAALSYSATTGRAAPGYYEAHHFHRVLQNPLGVRVELHWDLTRPDDFVRLDVARLAARRRAVTLQGIIATVPAPEDLLLHIAAQALDAGFVDLRHVLDAAFLTRAGATGSEGLGVRAVAAGLGPALWLLLELSRSWTGVAADPGLVSAVAPGPFVREGLAGLRLDERLLGVFVERHRGLETLLRWLCAPGGAMALREIGRFVWPPARDFAARGDDLAAGVPAARRLRLSAARAIGAAKLGAFLVASVGQG